MDLEIEEDWIKLIEDNCRDDGSITPTPIYTTIADIYPMALTYKLTFFAHNDDFNLSTRKRASFLLIDITDNSSRLDAAYPTVERETILPYLRRRSFRMMVENERFSLFQSAGIALATKLIILALHHGEEWAEFLEWLQRGFSGEHLVLELIFYIFCDMDHEMTVLFTLFLKPTVQRHYNQFRIRVVDLLQSDEGDIVHEYNYRGFRILLCFYSLFFDNKNHQTSVMEAAITSPIFNYDPHPDEELMVLCAKCIQLCIEKGPAFILSGAMIRKMNAIILRLYVLPEPDGRIVARELVVV